MGQQALFLLPEGVVAVRVGPVEGNPLIDLVGELGVVVHGGVHLIRREAEQVSYSSLAAIGCRVRPGDGGDYLPDVGAVDQRGAPPGRSVARLRGVGLDASRENSTIIELPRLYLRTSR